MAILTGQFSIVLHVLWFDSPHTSPRLSAVNIMNLILYRASIGKGKQVNATALHPPINYPDISFLPSLGSGVCGQNVPLTTAER